jgi:hypothetical protein
VSGEGANIEDQAAAVGDHLGDDHAGDAEDGDDVDGGDPDEVLDFGALELDEATVGNAGVVDEDSDLAGQTIEVGLERRPLLLGRLLQVESMMGVLIRRRIGLELRGQRLQLLLVAADKEDIETLLRELRGELGAELARRSGDDRPGRPVFRSSRSELAQLELERVGERGEVEKDAKEGDGVTKEEESAKEGEVENERSQQLACSFVS